MSTFFLVLTVILLIVGLIGSVIPIIPGTLLVGLTVLTYGWLDGFRSIGGGLTAVLVLAALVAGTADIWMPLLGAKTGGAPLKSLLFGLAGCALGFVAGSFIPLLGNLVGALAGYLGGIWYGEYRRLGDGRRALNAVIGGVAGWGLATAVQFVTSLVVVVVFLVAIF